MEEDASRLRELGGEWRTCNFFASTGLVVGARDGVQCGGPGDSQPRRVEEGDPDRERCGQGACVSICRGARRRRLGREESKRRESGEDGEGEGKEMVEGG